MNESVNIFSDDDFKEEKYLEHTTRDAKEIKKSLRLEQNYQGIWVWAVVSHRDFELNQKIEIPAKFGVSLTPEVHDTVNDVIYLEGISFLEIGYIPVNYRLIIEDADFDLQIPLPLAVIKKYMTPEQNKIYRSWKSAFKGADFQFRYFQVLDSE
jgi:hypothetical protein